MAPSHFKKQVTPIVPLPFFFFFFVCETTANIWISIQDPMESKDATTHRAKS